MFGNSAVHNNACMQDANIKIITTSYETAKVTIVSSLLGIFGSLMIIISHVCWKDLRKSTARTILLFLALADFAASVGYLFSAIAYLVVFSAVASHPGTNLTDSVGTFSTFCWIEGIWDTYFPVVSFLWTTNLAIYFVVTLVCRRSRLAKNLMIIFHLTAWFIPMIVCIAGVASGWLHPSGNPNAIEDTVSAAWCFVSDWKVSNITNKQMFDNKIALYYVMEAICGKGIEVAAYFVVAGCYAVIICHNKCRCCLRVSLAIIAGRL